MNKLLNEHQVVVFALLKILVMLGFFLNMAPLLVFAERKQSALIQDRIGPNRAVITVPGKILKMALPPSLAVLAIGIFVLNDRLFEGGDGTGSGRGFVLAHVAALVAWFGVLVLARVVRSRELARNAIERALLRLEDPRVIFYVGLVVHALLVVAYAGFLGPKQKLVDGLFRFFGPMLLTLELLLTAGYLGYALPTGPIELRAAGLFHSAADALKAAFKEDFVPPNADKLLHALGPLISLFPALVTFAVIPFGDTVCFGTMGAERTIDFFGPVTQASREICANGVPLQIVDMNVGILYLFAIAGTGIIGAAIAGWSSDNKWSLLGGLRAASQMVSYEVAMGLSIVGAFMIYGSPRLDDMVRWQEDNTWGIFVQPLAFFLFFAAAIAEQKRVPFDAPEGESEIIAGYFVEYSSFKWLMFYTGEYIEMVTSSALLVTIFLGGWSLPFLHRDGITVTLGDVTLWQAPMTHIGVTALQVLTFFGKVIALSFAQIFIRWTVPRFRYDQIMSFGWKMLLPASIANIVVTGLVILLLNGAGPAVQSTLRVLADATNFVVLGCLAFVAYRFVLLVVAPVERTRFVASGVAARTALRGGVKTEPMQA